jgi:4-hydroxy-3-methylbut-2-enyl diphosphate reductase
VPVIIGEQGHPEVIGICGWCEGAKVFADSRQLADWLDSVPDGRNLPITVVFQTTQTKTILEETKIFTKKECTNCEIFDTICSATSRRQNDAAGLSKKWRAMVVLGHFTVPTAGILLKFAQSIAAMCSLFPVSVS